MPTQTEIRQQITAEMVAALEAGTAPWRQPWANHRNSGSPTNAVSRKRYTGINPLILQVAAMRRGFNSKYWATYQQWRGLNGQVMRRPKSFPAGQWGTTIVFYKPIKKIEVEDDGEETETTIPVLRTFTVFNADQVEGRSVERFQVNGDMPTSSEFIDFDPAEEFIAAIPADIRFGGDRAFYDRGNDYIQMPPKNQFILQREYYPTLLHELAHWSESRLGWKGTYAEGELRAEIAACFAAAEIGIPQSEDMSNHHAYLQSWLGRMKEEPRFIFWASTAASRACDYLLSFSRKLEPAIIV